MQRSRLSKVKSAYCQNFLRNEWLSEDRSERTPTVNVISFISFCRFESRDSFIIRSLEISHDFPSIHRPRRRFRYNIPRVCELARASNANRGTLLRGMYNPLRILSRRLLLNNAAANNRIVGSNFSPNGYYSFRTLKLKLMHESGSDEGSSQNKPLTNVINIISLVLIRAFAPPPSGN